jgi:hypothetical protein
MTLTVEQVRSQLPLETHAAAYRAGQEAMRERAAEAGKYWGGNCEKRIRALPVDAPTSAAHE